MLKRGLDILAAFMGLLVLMPVIFLVAILIRIKLGVPIFFYQERPGLNEKPFKIIKFRTMLNTTGLNGEILPDSNRMTRLGIFLRSTSLDEIPELWNVLKGDMSIVGPRPLLMEYLPLYNETQRRRHDVRPGITGWAQVNGRNALSWDDKFKYDIWYVDNRTIWLDLKIILLTLKKVAVREGISSDGHVTTEKFRGSKK